jgi:RNA polymerase sigma-70 factor (ECF subfamily)
VIPTPTSSELFAAQRPRLLGIAYRMVGSLVDAEDIVSEAWVRWCAADRTDIASPEAWLTTVTTRIAIDWLRSARHNREEYVGPWLPEPVVAEAGPEERAELADSLTLGFLTMLDRLDPVDRAVFLMADVFDVPYADIADAVEKSPEACRQIASRARRRLRHPRRRARTTDRRVVDELLVALWMGDMDAVLARLAPDAVCITDGGANRTAARRPVVGASRVATFLANLTQRYHDQLTITAVTVNGEPGIVGRLDGQIDFVAAFEMWRDVVVTVRLVRNPDKLRLVERAKRLL